jgi:site-specific recombinase XerD
MTLKEAFDLYRLDCIVFRNQSPKTEENHYVCLRALILFFGDIEIESLSFEDIRNWKIHLDKGRSPVTVRCYIIKLRVVLAHFHKRGMAVVDPNLIPVPKRIQRIPSFVSREEVTVMINSTRRIKNKAIISFLYASGLRVSELCSLNRGQIRETGFTVRGKGGKTRLCFIDNRTHQLLEAYLNTRNDSEPALFLTDEGRRITPGVIQETFKSVRKTSGIDAHPHSLRHGFATDLLRNNTNMRHVQVMLGHSSLETTQMYAHVVDLDLQAAYKAGHKT